MKSKQVLTIHWIYISEIIAKLSDLPVKHWLVQTQTFLTMPFGGDELP